MPSMVAPSWLGQETTSIGADGHVVTWSPVVVSFLDYLLMLAGPHPRSLSLGDFAPRSGAGALVTDAT